MGRKKRREKTRKNTKNSNSKTIVMAILGIFLIIGVSYAISGSNNTKPKDDTEPGLKLPSYAYTNPITLKAYKYAATHPDVLEQIPCYCGCGGHSGHRFLRDCFLDDNRNFGDHASYCDICIGEASKVQDYLASGMTLKEARAKIDAEYSAKYPGEGTDTPPVKDNYKPILTPLTT